MSGKATPPTAIGKLVDRVMEFALANYASNTKVRRVFNRPLAKLVQTVAETGEMFPLGLLPNAIEPCRGPWTHSSFIEDTMTKSNTS